MRRLLAILVLASLVLPAVPTALAQDDSVRFDFDARDAEGDVLLIASNGSEKTVPKPEADLVRFQSERVDGDLVVTLTFAGPIGEEGLGVQLDATLRPISSGSMMLLNAEFKDGEVANANTRASGATAAFEGEMVMIRVPGDALEGAECFAPSVRIKYAPEDDPVATSDEGRQGWQDQWSLRPTACPGFDGSPEADLTGLDGSCPAFAPPNGITIPGTLEDPRGDVKQALTFEDNTIDRPWSDVLGITTRIDGNVVVVEVELAQWPPNEESVLLTAYHEFGGYESEYQFESPARIVLGFDTNAHSVSADYAAAMGSDGLPQTTQIYAWGERDGNTAVWRYCASVIPKDIPCFAPSVYIETRENDVRAYDKAGYAWNEGPCAGKETAGGNDDGGNAGGDDGTPDTGGGSRDGGADTGGMDEPEDDTSTPGAALPLALAVIASAAIALRRRS